MLKRAAAFLAALLMLTSVVFAADGNETEYTEPTEEEKAAMTEIVDNAFLVSSEFGGGVLPDDGDVMDYLIWSGEFWEGGAFYKYVVTSDFEMEYTIPYDQFISTVDKHFALHSDMKEYFGENYNKAANTVYISFGGSGGYGIDMEPECFLRVKDKNEYHVLGVKLDVMFDETLTDEMKPHVDYFPQVFEDGDMQPCYLEGCFDFSFEKDGDHFRMSGMKKIDYYISDGKVYLRGSSDYPDVRKLAGIYNNLTIEADGASVSCENAREFGYLAGLWLPESTEVTFKVQAEDGMEVESVTYNDGTEKTLMPTGNGTYKVKTGEGAVTLTVKTKTAETEPPVETDEITALPETNASTETVAPNTETNAPGTDTGDAGDEGGCGSVMSVSAVAAAAAVAALAVFKRRH